MRKYLISYYVEQMDVCTDLEKVIEADNIEQALKDFKEQVRMYRRITSISEIPNMELFENNSLIKKIETHDTHSNT